ncbi:GGDEF domain-containing protein [Undibacterium sp. Ren11W]|uniref:GGDEF domain-containing protein n=1 Tax=Undibacterium sp. Ren11W TaxID=3413045 RepID=UPI003BF00CD3
MSIRRLKHKLLLSVVSISLLVALAFMLAASLLIRQQHLDQSNALLHKASKIIQNTLDERKNLQLIATRRLANQSNLGSTVWYLTQYAQSEADRDTLFSTYQQLVKDTYKLARTAQLSKTSIYDASGSLVSFATLDGLEELAGFVERTPKPGLQIFNLTEGEEISRKTLSSRTSVDSISLNFGTNMPKQEKVQYAVVDGFLAVVCQVPIFGLAFDANTGKQENKQQGLVVSVQTIDQNLVDRLSRLSDTKINVFTRLGYSVGNLPAYLLPEWSGVPTGASANNSDMALNEITVDGEGFYQNLIPILGPQQIAGTIVALHSKKIVQNNTWQMIGILALIAFGSLILIFPFTWYFANSISQPLTTLSRVFRGVANGQQVDAMSAEWNQLAMEKTRDDELGDLTQSFIMMVAAVKQKIQQINEINASLEQRIEQSTAQLRTANLELRRLANIDALTGLYNRRAFFEIASLATAQSKRSQRDLCLIMIDVDNFKSINDRYGHPVGDQVLRQIGLCLATTARESDTPARYGGEEFVVLAADTGIAEGIVLAERIRQALKTIEFDVNVTNIAPTASMGVGCLRQDETFEQLCVRADAAMYQAKNAGRDRVSEAI